MQGARSTWCSEQQPWRPLQDAQGRELPRRAGVSSFGFGGVNAHVVIEEYVPRPDALRPLAAVSPTLIVLSAKNGERLKEQAARLVADIERRLLGDDDLANVAYTLQVGREGMANRLALTATSMAELVSKLKAYLSGRGRIEEFYLGEVSREEGTLSVFTAEDMAQIVEPWVRQGKYGKLLQLWVKGLSFDWQHLYHETKPRRVPLPTYPFAKERYWIEPAGRERPVAASGSGAGILHPFLHRNTSDLSAQRFSTKLDGEEYYLRDHVAGGVRVLPEMVQLEMVRAAITAAASPDAQAGLRLQQVTWTRPVIIGQEGLELHIELFANEDGKIEYEIYSATEASDGVPIIYGRGHAVVGSVPAVSDVDIVSLQEGCDARGERLVTLALPPSGREPAGDYVLHPTILEAALQASAGLAMDGGAPFNSPLQPLALEEVLVISPCPVRGFAWVHAGQASNKLDIDVCDEAGRVCVRLRGFSSRAAVAEVCLPGRCL